MWSWSALVCTEPHGHKPKTKETNTKLSAVWVHANRAAIGYIALGATSFSTVAQNPQFKCLRSRSSWVTAEENFAHADVVFQETTSDISPLCCSTDISFVKDRTSFISLSTNVSQVNFVVNASWQKEVYMLCNNTRCHSLEEKILQGQLAPMRHNYRFAKENRWLVAVTLFSA